MNCRRPLLVGEQQPGGVERRRSSEVRVGDHLQELDQVEVVDQGVGDLDEHLGEPFGCKRSS